MRESEGFPYEDLLPIRVEVVVIHEMEDKVTWYLEEKKWYMRSQGVSHSCMEDREVELHRIGPDDAPYVKGCCMFEDL
ncbi:hypothetical protein Tco_0931134 [Tanacetum coccineum]